MLLSCNADGRYEFNPNNSKVLEKAFSILGDAYKKLNRGNRNSKMPYCIISVSKIQDTCQCLYLDKQQCITISNELSEIKIHNIYIYDEKLILFEYKRDFTPINDNTYFIGVCSNINMLEKGLDFTPQKTVKINDNIYSFIRSKASF